MSKPLHNCFTLTHNMIHTYNIPIHVRIHETITIHYYTIRTHYLLVRGNTNTLAAGQWCLLPSYRREKSDRYGPVEKQRSTPQGLYCYIIKRLRNFAYATAFFGIVL